jgi:hypothetical protein
LTASNPKAIPNKGPKKLINSTKEGRVPSEAVNNFKKRNELSGSSGLIAAPILVSAVYSDPIQVSAMIPIRIRKRQLLT